MMGVIGVQISQGLITGEPFDILAHSMVYNIMAWFSLASILFYIFSNVSWGPMRKAEMRAQALISSADVITGTPEETHDEPEDDNDIIDHPNCHTSLNFFIPILSTILMCRSRCIFTGDGEFSKGSGSTSVYWGVMFGTAVSICLVPGAPRDECRYLL